MHFLLYSSSHGQWHYFPLGCDATRLKLNQSAMHLAPRETGCHHKFVKPRKGISLCFLIHITSTYIIPASTHDTASQTGPLQYVFFFCRSSKFSKLQAKRTKFKTLRMPEINITFVRTGKEIYYLTVAVQLNITSFRLKRKAEAKRRKVKSLRFKAMPKTVEARTNPEINITLVRCWKVIY